MGFGNGFGDGEGEGEGDGEGSANALTGASVAAPSDAAAAKAMMVARNIGLSFGCGWRIDIQRESGKLPSRELWCG